MTMWNWTPWKRWSLPYRAAILLVASMLLHGCVVLPDLVPSYTIPGVRGAVYAAILYTETGVPYYQVLTSDDGKGTRGYRFIYPGNAEYDAIVNFFRSHPQITVFDLKPAGIPGGTGTPPPPPVQ
jgi:hypothetical protein